MGVILISGVDKAKSQNTKVGLILATIAGVIWGSQLVPMKIGNISAQEFFFPLCLGIMVAGLVIFLFSKKEFKKLAIKEGLLSGVIIMGFA